MLEDGMMAFALLGAGWVLWVLVGLSIGCIAISLERSFYLLRDATPPTVLAEAIGHFLKSGDPAKLRDKLSATEGFEARVLSAGLELADAGPAAIEQAMRGTLTAEKLKMERGLPFLATVGSNAPFFGLFGTVLGIIKAFHDLALNTGEASEAVMAGISEALVATAVGLLVAIPAVILYNLFARWVKGRVGRIDSLADTVVARLRASSHAGGSAEATS